MVIHPLVFRLQQELKKQLCSGKAYVLAVSGGADSIALAHVASGLQDLFGFTVCHVEHGIRGTEALSDAALVEELCAHLLLPFYCCHVDVPKEAEANGLTLEEAARKLRYEALEKVADKVSAAGILTAHHKNDQAETVLLKLLRGAGLEGLAGMDAEHDNIIRPWLSISRSELEEYCQLNALQYCIDSTNYDTSYTRNRVRLELLPYLRRDFNPNIVDTLVRTADLLRDDAECITSMAAQYYRESQITSEKNKLVFRMSKLMELPAAIRKRILRQAYFNLGGKELSFERTEAMELLCRRGIGGKLLQLPGSITVCYKNKLLVLSKREDKVKEL